MSNQPIPAVTHADIQRLVQRDFPADRVTQVLALLNEYGTENWHRETHRVRAALLRLAAGNIKSLRSELYNAKKDYRDVLAAAEYPLYFKQVPGPGKVSPQDEQRIIDSDWHQYQIWFHG